MLKTERTHLKTIPNITCRYIFPNSVWCLHLFKNDLAVLLHGWSAEWEMYFQGISWAIFWVEARYPLHVSKLLFFFFFEFASYVEGMMRSYMEELLSLPSDHGILIFSHFVILKVPSLWRSSEWWGEEAENGTVNTGTLLHCSQAHSHQDAVNTGGASLHCAFTLPHANEPLYLLHKLLFTVVILFAGLGDSATDPVHSNVTYIVIWFYLENGSFPSIKYYLACVLCIFILPVALPFVLITIFPLKIENPVKSLTFL